MVYYLQSFKTFEPDLTTSKKIYTKHTHTHNLIGKPLTHVARIWLIDFKFSLCYKTNKYQQKETLPLPQKICHKFVNFFLFVCLTIVDFHQKILEHSLRVLFYSIQSLFNLLFTLLLSFYFFFLKYFWCFLLKNRK